MSKKKCKYVERVGGKNRISHFLSDLISELKTAANFCVAKDHAEHTLFFTRFPVSGSFSTFSTSVMK